MTDKLTVGDLARLTHTTPKTVRYYESIGLVIPEARGGNGYRYYNDTHVQQLRFIRRAQGLGLTLAEIGQLMELARDARCNDLRSSLDTLFTQKIREYELKIAALQTLKKAIQPEEGACVCQAFVPDCSCLPSPVEIA
ncbi:MAG: MerR family transcriptional regulator [Anaerolineae bacterium]